MSGLSVRFNRLDRQYQTLRKDIHDLTDKVFTSGRVLGTPGGYADQFAEAIAKRCHRKFAIPVNSCTSGIHIALNSIIYENEGIGFSKITIPTYSFIATLFAIPKDKLKHEFVDIDPNTGIMDLDELGNSTHQRDIIMYVNLFGNIIDYDKMKFITEFFTNKRPPIIVEDAAQSFGSYYKGRPSGSLGDVSVLSFDPTKNLPNYGSGGMVLTDDPKLATNIRDHSRNSRQLPTINIYREDGNNSQMSELDCAIMLRKLDFFDAWQERRAQIARYYTDNLNETIITPHRFISEDVIPNWHKYVVLFPSRRIREAVKHELENHYVETKVHYAVPLTGVIHDNNALALSKKCLSLPIYPEMTDNEVEYVVEQTNYALLDVQKEMAYLG